MSVLTLRQIGSIVYLHLSILLGFITHMFSWADRLEIWKSIFLPNDTAQQHALILTFQNPIQYASAPSLFPSPPYIKKVKVNIKAAWSPTNRCKLVYLW